MHKPNDKNALRGRMGFRIFLGVSLATFVAGLGACSTNYTPGDGQPVGSTSYGTTPSAATYGSSGGVRPQSRMIVAPDVITPMFSSSSEAAGVLAGHQGRFLGYANPGPAPANYGIDIPTGQVIPPALMANPEQTVNSSISSAPTPVITSGAGGGAGGGAIVFSGASVAAPVNAAITSGVTAAVTAPLTTTVITAPQGATAPIFGTPSTIATPTNTALSATPGSFAAGPGASAATTSTNTNVIANQNTNILTPTMTSALTPSPTLASNPPIGSLGSAATASNVAAPVTPLTTVGRTATGRLTVPRQVLSQSTVSPTSTSANMTLPVMSATRSRAVAKTSAITGPLTIPGRVARPVRMTSSSNGGVTITNQ